jgi:hypothetical protein
VTVEEAIRLFEVNRVPDWRYTAGGLGGGECEGIDYLNGKWVVYYSERGKRRRIEEFDSEAEAVEKWVNYVDRGLKDAEGRNLDRQLTGKP